MTNPRYATPQAFKQALEQRLKTVCGSSAELARRRQLVVFERFLARIGQQLGDAAVLKGGLVLELRLDRARTTKDVDLRMMGTPDELLDRLQDAGRFELPDFMRFEIRPDRRHPEIQGDGMKYTGHRYTAECRLADKIYGRPFGVDIGFGDPLVGEPDEVAGDDMLAFAGIEPARLRVYPRESHIAEKLHAYTIPRTRPNSRVKDLPDIALLATTGRIEARQLRTALETTFVFRATHALPEDLQPPPPHWGTSYAAMAAEDALPWPTIDAVHEAVDRFLDPILQGDAQDTVWSPPDWRWME